MTLLIIVLFATALTTWDNCNATQQIAISFNEKDPMVAFAVGDIQRAVIDAGYSVEGSGADLQIVFDIFRPGMGPQAFRIRKEGGNVIRIVGGDSLGAMYGGLSRGKSYLLLEMKR